MTVINISLRPTVGRNREEASSWLQNLSSGSESEEKGAAFTLLGFAPDLSAVGLDEAGQSYPRRLPIGG